MHNLLTSFSQVYNQFVCNCHEDSKLLYVIRLVEKVYSAKTTGDKEESGRKLKDAIEDFLDEFLHHMKVRIGCCCLYT